MQRHFVVQRTTSSDWYDKAKSFLADNQCAPLLLEVSSKVDSAVVFQQALAALSSVADQPVTIDPEAEVLVVTADLTKRSGDPRCACQCGTSTGTGQTCGGGGGGCRPQ
jgi:hypothetical protein